MFKRASIRDIMQDNKFLTHNQGDIIMDNTTNQKPGNGKIWGAIAFCWFPLIAYLLYFLDAKAVVKYCKDFKHENVSEFGLSILWLLIFPAYIWKRNKLLETSQATFFVSLVLIVLVVVASVATGA